MIAFDPDFERDGMAVLLHVFSLMSSDSAVDAQVPGVLKLVEISSLFFRARSGCESPWSFLGEISNHIKINSHVSERERKREIGRERERGSKR